MKLAPLSEMWEQYPIGPKADVAALIGGPCETNITKYDWDTCCIRLSRSLNYSGTPVTGFGRIANPGLGADAKVRAVKGGDDKWYIYSCYDLHAYLVARFGMPKVYGGKMAEGGGFADQGLADAKGIVMFARRHVDLWNGSEVRYNRDFTDGTKTVTQILIWKTPA